MNNIGVTQPVVVGYKNTLPLVRKPMLQLTLVTTDTAPIAWLAERFNLHITQTPPKNTSFFLYQNGYLYLKSSHHKIQLSLTELLPKDIHKHALYKLIQQYASKGSNIIDCTGGLGKDSLIALYASQNQVITFERNHILAIALCWLQQICPSSSWDVRHEDATSYHDRGGLWLIDPMFPDHPKMAKAQKRMQIIQNLVPYSDDTHTLIAHAKKLADRLFIKKPMWEQGNAHLGLWSEVTLND